MVEIIRIPKLGLSDYGDLVSWEAEDGEQVSAGDVVAIIESEKASAEVEAPANGTLLGHYVEEGEEIEIEVGKPLAVIGDEGEEIPDISAIEDGSEVSTEGNSGKDSSSENQTTPSDIGSDVITDVKATPRAKRLATDKDINLKQIEGTGPQGAVSEEDVQAFLESSDTDTKGDVQGVGAEQSSSEGLTVTDSRKLTGTRKTIAKRLSQSAREKPHVMGTREVSVERIQALQSRLAERYDVEISLNDLILFFVGRVLRDLPEFNAHFEDGEHKLIDELNIGYAVDGPNGLVVPVIDDVTGRSLSELAERRRKLVGKVLDNDFTSADLQDGTFTVTNVGVFNMDVSYSIINPPEVAILAIGRRKQAPVERDGKVEFETVVTMSLTIDHRVLDGADSGAFLERLAEYLEYPGGALESVQNEQESV